MLQLWGLSGDQSQLMQLLKWSMQGVTPLCCIRAGADNLACTLQKKTLKKKEMVQSHPLQTTGWHLPALYPTMLSSSHSSNLSSHSLVTIAFKLSIKSINWVELAWVAWAKGPGSQAETWKRFIYFVETHAHCGAGYMCSSPKDFCISLLVHLAELHAAPTPALLCWSSHPCPPGCFCHVASRPFLPSPLCMTWPQ